MIDMPTRLPRLNSKQVAEFAQIGSRFAFMPHLQLHINVKERPLHVENASCCLATQATLHGSKAALCG
jgi:hypothetical protein